MSRRSKAAYWSQLERPISWCDNRDVCGNRGARYSKKDEKKLCRCCRATLKKTLKPVLTEAANGC